MNRYVLTYQGYGEAPDALASRLQEESGVRVVDRFGNNLVVEGPRKELTELVSGLRGWFSAPERRVRQPGLFLSG
jgi:hypothetical protein